jgi:hypothetical protein
VGFGPKGKYGLPLSGVSVQETTFHDPTSGLISTQKPRLAERIRAAISFTLDAPFAMNQSITNAKVRLATNHLSLAARTDISVF